MTSAGRQTKISRFKLCLHDTGCLQVLVCAVYSCSPHPPMCCIAGGPISCSCLVGGDDDRAREQLTGPMTGAAVAEADAGARFGLCLSETVSVGVIGVQHVHSRRDSLFARVAASCTASARAAACTLSASLYDSYLHSRWDYVRAVEF